VSRFYPLLFTSAPMIGYFVYHNALFALLASYTLPACLASSAFIWNISSKYCSNHTLVKSVIYNKDTLEIQINFLTPYKKPVNLRVGSFAIKDMGNSYSIISGLEESFTIYKKEKLNHKVLNYIANPKFHDKEVEALLMKNGRLINFSCSFVGSHVNDTLDHALRRKLLSDKVAIQKLTTEEIHLNMLKIPDNQVNDYLDTLDHHFQTQIDKNALVKEVEEFIYSCGLPLEKAKELKDILFSRYHVRQLSHLKGFKDLELESTIKTLDLTNSEASELREKIGNIK
jgi:hypothetical protein